MGTGRARGKAMFGRASRVDRLHDFLVATAARRLRHGAIRPGDPDRLVEPSGREHERVAKPVRCLHREFRNERVRRVTIVTGGHGAVASPRPPLVLGLHHVAVGASRRVVSQVRRSFRIVKREAGHADRGAGQGGHQPARQARDSHEVRRRAKIASQKGSATARSAGRRSVRMSALPAARRARFMGRSMPQARRRRHPIVVWTAGLR